MTTISRVVTVSDARDGLSRILSRLEQDGEAAEPVLIGAHRKPQGVLMSVELYEAMLGRSARQRAVDSAAGSLAAEGLRFSAATDGDVGAFVRGEISSDDLVAKAVARHARGTERRAE